MRAILDGDRHFKLLIYGETEQHGGVRLTPLDFGAATPDGTMKITDTTTVVLEKPPAFLNLNCYRGTIRCDSKEHRVTIDLEVRDDDEWKPFGWNGSWPLED